MAGQFKSESAWEAFVQNHAHLLDDVRSELISRLFQEFDYLVAADRWEILQKDVDRVAGFQAVGQVFDRHPRASKHRCAVEDLRIGSDEMRIHEFKMSPEHRRCNELKYSDELVVVSRTVREGAHFLNFGITISDLRLAACRIRSVRIYLPKMGTPEGEPL